MTRFKDRSAAGIRLAEVLLAKAYPDPVVLALPRGGVPVAVEIARALKAPLDLVMVRKLGVPSQPELAAGAVVNGDQPEIVVNQDIARDFRLTSPVQVSNSRHIGPVRASQLMALNTSSPIVAPCFVSPSARTASNLPPSFCHSTSSSKIGRSPRSGSGVVWPAATPVPIPQRCRRPVEIG